MVSRGAWLCVAMIAVILTAIPVAGQEADEVLEVTGPAVLARGDAWVFGRGQKLQVPVSETALGPLVALQPLVSWLGGELVVGPLGRSHSLELDGSVARFGPGSGRMTVEQEIVALSQPPQPGLGGLHVPVDLLDRLYGEQLGLEFRWRREERILEIVQKPRREIPVQVDVVHLAGLTTLSLRFSDNPKHRIEELGDTVRIFVDRDSLVPPEKPLEIRDPLVRAVRIAPQQVEIRLMPGAVAKGYELDSPPRLVFDVYAASGEARPSVSEGPGRSRVGPWTVVLDPGHGGSETGAVGPGGTEEKTLTLQLARLLKRRLQEKFGFKVILTREEDAFLPLETRTAIANQNRARLFVSIHLNSSVGSGARGAETYFLSLEATDESAEEIAERENTSPGDLADPLDDDLRLILWDLAQSHFLAESQRLGNLVQQELNITLGLRDRGVKQAPFRVLMGASMPAILVELGFVSHPEEEGRLLQPVYRAELVEALVRAIARYRAEAAVSPGDEQVEVP